MGMILLGVTMQAGATTSVVAFLIIRRQGLTEADEAEIAATEKQIEMVESEVRKYLDNLQSILTAPGTRRGTFELLAEAAARDPEVANKLQPGEQKILQRMVKVRSQLDRLAKEVGKIEQAARRWKMPVDRIACGIALACVCLISSLQPALFGPSRAAASETTVATPAGASKESTPSGASSGSTAKLKAKPAPITGAYLALASISCVCASLAYAMLGRRKTDEVKFLEDLVNVNTTVRVLREVAGQGLSLRK
jgi:hypothetical protein